MKKSVFRRPLSLLLSLTMVLSIGLAGFPPADAAVPAAVSDGLTGGAAVGQPWDGVDFDNLTNTNVTGANQPAARAGLKLRFIYFGSYDHLGSTGTF